ncbi:MAG: MATE family efflux transporter [Planctomycetaceae bacterium]
MTESSSDPHHAAGSFRELLAVSLPLIISAGSLSVMSAVDRIMLAGYSVDALAAVTPASMLHWTVICVPMGMILYANTFIAQFDGAGRPGRVAASVWQAVWLAIISGLLLTLLTPFTHDVLSLTGHAASVVREESSYFNVLCLGSLGLLTSEALGTFYSGRRRTNVVMAVNVLGVVINFALDYVFIYGVGPFPQLGIRGAALATVLARVSGIVAYLILIRRENQRAKFPFPETWKPDSGLLRKFLRFGLPSGLHYFVDNSGFTAFLLIVGTLNADALAATNLAFSVNGLIFVPLLGFGTAVQTLVGHHIGAGLQPAAIRTTWNAVRMALVWTGGAGVLLILCPEMSLKPFQLFARDSSPETESLKQILPTAVLLLQFVAVYSVFDALAVVFSSALRGAGDTLFPMLLTMFSSWLVMTIPALLVVQSESASITKLWLCCTAHITTMGSAMLLRFLSGRWKHIQLIDTAQELP